MKLVKITKKIKCDTPGCKALSVYELCLSEKSSVGNLVFCDNCINKIYSAIGKMLVPEPLPPAFKNNKK